MCGRQDLEWILFPMARCVGQIRGHLHHGPHDFPCYLYLLCAWYDGVLEMPTQNVLSNHMHWWKSLGSNFFLSAFLALGLRLGSLFCYNLNWKEILFLLGPQKMIRRPPSLPMLRSCVCPILSASYIPCLSGDCESSHWCLEAWSMSSGLGISSEICYMVHLRLTKIKNNN